MSAEKPVRKIHHIRQQHDEEIRTQSDYKDETCRLKVSGQLFKLSVVLTIHQAARARGREAEVQALPHTALQFVRREHIFAFFMPLDVVLDGCTVKIVEQ